MNRNGRLQAAPRWIEQYTGKRWIRGYCNYFAVDVRCAIAELSLLGMKLNPEEVARVIAGEEERIRHRQKLKEKRKAKKEAELNMSAYDSDFHHAIIIGYTPGGFSYGITWEEYDSWKDDASPSANESCYIEYEYEFEDYGEDDRETNAEHSYEFAEPDFLRDVKPYDDPGDEESFGEEEFPLDWVAENFLYADCAASLDETDLQYLSVSEPPDELTVDSGDSCGDLNEWYCLLKATGASY